MKNSDYLFNITEAIKKYCNSLPFPEDDIRRDFHGMAYDLIYNYYCGYVAYELSQNIIEGKVMFNEEMYKHKTHIDRITEVTKKPLLTTSYISSLNKQIIIGIWTSFEISITTLAEAILSIEEKEELHSIECNEILKLLQHESVSDGAVQKIKTKLTKTHLTHLPAWRKFNALIKHSGKEYTRNKPDDFNFLNFYGKMRNTLVHANGIYYGKNDEYTFEKYKFLFENGKLFRYTEDTELRPRIYIDLVSNLSNIFTAITDLLTDIKKISYPDTGIYWDE